MGAKKRGQMKMSFGMIFSIILIIVFLALAFYVIKVFLGVGDCAKTGKFLDGLQKDVDKIWSGSQGSQEIEYSLDKKVKQICFTNKVYENLYFEPFDSGCDFRDIIIKHIDIEKIIESQDPFCITNKDGEIKLKIKKSFGENLVIITE